MSTFEKTYQIDPSRESKQQRERHYSIELSDQDHLAKLSPQITRGDELEKDGFIVRLSKDIPLTPQKEVVKNEKSKSKSPKSKPKKVPAKSNKAAMARI